MLYVFTRRHCRSVGISATSIAAISLVLCLFSPGMCAEQDWPSFRGPSASGVAEGYSTPAKWDLEQGKNIRWKTPVPGLAHSSPTIWGDRIFVTTAVQAGGESTLKVGLYGDVTSVEENDAFDWRLYCVDKKDGKIMWTRQVYTGKPRVKRHAKSTHANSTPCTDGNFVVAFFGSEGLYCYDIEGNLAWKKDLGVLDWGFFRSPAAQWAAAARP